MIACKRTTAAVLVVTILCSAAGSSACTSMKSIAPATTPGLPLFGTVKAGDTVSLVSNGRHQRFVVRSVDDTSLTSQSGVRYEAAEIPQLKRRSISRAKTTCLVLGLTSGTFLVVLAVALAKLYGEVLSDAPR